MWWGGGGWGGGGGGGGGEHSRYTDIQTIVDRRDAKRLKLTRVHPCNEEWGL